ncbi:hypothetical protein M378DRAFT_382127 [Amanita muscaria Koide BX008]|uniref:Uncharacterized protein n=1 Tax=Amanita muscaria (strain Koide BX008) TaxID=946122 RepID=A0A0C2WLE8_AMAMK|nr:hypothetical protein M378DRAFT_382127 [Amanita muscaria Koide BX008]
MAYQLKIRLSGGTLNSMFTKLDDDPVKISQARKPYSLSPGSYKLSIPEEKPLVSGHFVMRGSNTATSLWATRNSGGERTGLTIAPASCCDTGLKTTTQSAVKALTASYGFALMIVSFAYVRPIRQFARKSMSQPGDGPSEEKLQKGSLIGTNLTTSDTQPPLQVESVIKISRQQQPCALSLLLPPVSVDSDTNTYSAIATFLRLAQQGDVFPNLEEYLTERK